MKMLSNPRRSVEVAPTVQPRRRTVRALAIVATFAALIAGAVALAPTSIGGRDEYIVTSGTSMLPAIQPNSFVLIRRESSYHVGDVVAYHNKELHATVLHRIIAIHGKHYEFKGDNNSFADFYYPTAKDLYGKKVFYSHTVGQVLLNLRTPLVGAALCFIFTIWVLAGSCGPSTGDDGRNNRSKRHGRDGRTTRGDADPDV